MDQRIGILARHHRRLLDIIAAVRPLLTGARADADLAGMGYLRRESVEAMAAYRRFVREDVLERATEWDGQVDALALAAAAAEIDAAYDAFRARWAERDIAEHWSEYRLSALRMSKAMMDGLTRAAGLPARWAERPLG